MDAALVTMVKDGQRLEVHPSCVADHKRLRWHIASAPAVAEDDAAASNTRTPARRKAPAKNTQE